MQNPVHTLCTPQWLFAWAFVTRVGLAEVALTSIPTSSIFLWCRNSMAFSFSHRLSVLTREGMFCFASSKDDGYRCTCNFGICFISHAHLSTHSLTLCLSFSLFSSSSACTSPLSFCLAPLCIFFTLSVSLHLSLCTATILVSNFHLAW